MMNKYANIIVNPVGVILVSFGLLINQSINQSCTFAGKSRKFHDMIYLCTGSIKFRNCTGVDPLGIRPNLKVTKYTNGDRLTTGLRRKPKD